MKTSKEVLASGMKDQLDKLIQMEKVLDMRKAALEMKEKKVAYREQKVSEREKRIFGRVLNG